MNSKNKNNPVTQPQGEVVIRTIAMPADTNSNGDIFGGWLISQMDLGGSIFAKDIAQGRVVTVAIDGMEFIHPVHVGDTVTCYARRQRVGNTSVGIIVEAWVQRHIKKQLLKVTEGEFTFVAIDEQGKPKPIPKAE